MRITGIPNKYEILQQYYLEENGEQITYTEAMTRYYELTGDEKDDFVQYYNDFCKEYYGDDSVDYEPIDENGYNWRNAPTGEYATLVKNDLRVKYTLEAYAKEQGLTLDPQWAGYSAEEIIQMENNGVNIPKDVLEIAHSIYETTGSNYMTTESEAEENATSEKEPFLELVPKAAKKIEKCEENNEKISDEIENIIPEQQKQEKKLSDKLKKQRNTLDEYETNIREWAKLQDKMNNGEVLTDNESTRYKELSEILSDKKNNDDGFEINKTEIANTLSQINILALLGRDLADETIEIGETLEDYTSETNYKTTKQSVTKEVGFIRSLIAMVKGKNLAEESVKIGNDTKEYSLETVASVNNIASTLDIKDKIAGPEGETDTNIPTEADSEISSGEVKETDGQQNSEGNSQENSEANSQEKLDMFITDQFVLKLIDEGNLINADLLKQINIAKKQIADGIKDNKLASVADKRISKIVQQFWEEEAKRQQEIETKEQENEKAKNELEKLTGKSSKEIDKEIIQNDNSKDENESEYDEETKEKIKKQKEIIVNNNEDIENIKAESIKAREEVQQNTSKEKTAIDKALPVENDAFKINSLYQEKDLPEHNERMDFINSAGARLMSIGAGEVLLGGNEIQIGQALLASVFTWQHGIALIALGTLTIVKGTTSIGIGAKACKVSDDESLIEEAEETTDTASTRIISALDGLNNVNEKIVAVTKEFTVENNEENASNDGGAEGQQEGQNSGQTEQTPEQTASTPLQTVSSTIQAVTVSSQETSTVVTTASNTSESPEPTSTQTENEIDSTVQETTSAVTTNNPSNSSPVPVSPVTQAYSIEGMRTSIQQTNNTHKAAGVAGTANISGSSSSSSGKSKEVPEINKSNAKSEAKNANGSLGSMKSETEKGQKETEDITKDEEKSEKELGKEAKVLEKKITKESKEMEKIQKETEKIQQQQLEILTEFEQLTVQNEQLVAEAQAAASIQTAQPAQQNNNQNQQGGLLGSNSFNVGQAQNTTVNEKVASIETNNQRISQLGIEFTSNNKVVQRNQKKISSSQKFIKTSNKKFQKVTKTKEKKANERVKAEEAKQKALQQKLGFVGIFEKVFQVVTAIGSLLSAIPFTAALGAVLTNIGLGGTVFCATVKAGILAANGMIDQAFMTLGMSIATAALSMVGAGAAASSGLQIATAALNVVSSAASLGASVQEFKGKDAGILGSIATIAGAASAVTGAVGAFGSLGKAGTSALSKMSTITMQSGSMLSTSSQMINQVREWQGKEGDSKLANIMGMVGMGLTLVGTAGNIAAGIQSKKAEKADNAEGKDGENKTEKGEKTDKPQKEDGENSGDETKTDKGEGTEDGQTSGSQNSSNTDVKTSTDGTGTDTNTTKTDTNTNQTDVQQQQGEQLKQAATGDPNQQTEEAINEINQTVENNSNPKENPTPESTAPDGTAPEGTAPEAEGTEGGQPRKNIEDMTPEERLKEAAELAKEAQQQHLQKAIDDLAKGTAKLEIKPLDLPKAPQQSKFEKFMDKAQPYMDLVGTAGQLAASIMTSNDETDDDTKRKVIPAWEFDSRTQEIMKKRRKRQEALRRYFA